LRTRCGQSGAGQLRIVQLLEKTLIRVGNDEYAKDNESFGLTTLRDKHVEVSGAKLTFTFRGKSGVQHEVPLNNRRLARVVKACRESAGIRPVSVPRR